MKYNEYIASIDTELFEDQIIGTLNPEQLRDRINVLRQKQGYVWCELGHNIPTYNNESIVIILAKSDYYYPTITQLQIFTLAKG